MQCLHCSALAPKDAHFCPQCGHRLVWPQHAFKSSAGSGRGWGTFFLTLLLSVGLSLVLTVAFHLPIFILGAALPLMWIGRPKLR